MVEGRGCSTTQHMLRVIASTGVRMPLVDYCVSCSAWQQLGWALAMLPEQTGCLQQAGCCNNTAAVVRSGVTSPSVGGRPSGHGRVLAAWRACREPQCHHLLEGHPWGLAV
jgi:hypothetical protein